MVFLSKCFEGDDAKIEGREGNKGSVYQKTRKCRKCTIILRLHLRGSQSMFETISFFLIIFLQMST